LETKTKKKKKKKKMRNPMRKSPLMMKNEQKRQFLEKEFLKIS